MQMWAQKITSRPVSATVKLSSKETKTLRSSAGAMIRMIFAISLAAKSTR